jgi:tRNA nucleotidyltransferase (CCA-adding enzyme)
VRVTVYDHHPADDDDVAADLAVVEPVGSATTLLVERMDEAGVTLDGLEATLLALGIHADTGSLTYSATTARDARALGRLLDQGASLPVLARYLAPAFSPRQQAVLAELLGALEVERVGHLHVAFVHVAMSRAVQGFAQVVSELLKLTGHAAVFAVFGIAERRVQVVARSRAALIDVGMHAAAVGGGGHPGAAAASLKRGDSLAVLEELRAFARTHPPVARRVADIMSSPVRTVPVSLPFRELERSLVTWRHTGVPVTRDGALSGMVSRSDVERARRDGRLDLPVASAMSHTVHSIEADASPEEALAKMTDHDVGRLPVLRGGELVGIVTRSDLRRLLYGEPSSPSAAPAPPFRRPTK